MEKCLFSLGSIIAAIIEGKYQVGDTIPIGKEIQLLVITDNSFTIRGRNGKELDCRLPQRSVTFTPNNLR
jgi:hypothetical protein